MTSRALEWPVPHGKEKTSDLEVKRGGEGVGVRSTWSADAWSRGGGGPNGRQWPGTVEAGASRANRAPHAGGGSGLWLVWAGYYGPGLKGTIPFCDLFKQNSMDLN
jgi:hypothetical protein